MATTENGTYYPSDYSSVADVPGDMKKMAESIDANKVQKIKGKGLSTNDFTNEYKQKLEDLENYDDTEVKKDISDIKEEQETQNTNIENLQEKDTTQDELIEKLQQENKNIKSALINVETEQAKSLHIEDASTVAGVLEVEGNAEQETREGYNLLNSSLFNLSEVSNYATFNKEDGTITFNGTANTDINIRSLRKQIIAGTGKENIVIKIISGSLNGLLRLAAQDTDYGNIKYSQIGTSSFVNKLTESVEYNIFSITITNGTVMNNLKLGFMIVDDSNLDKEYEPYGAMPSVNYPSKIKCLGSNKNYFNKDTVTQNKYLSYQNEEIENNSWTYTDYIECKPNEDWIISGYTTIGGAPSRCFYNANKSLVGGGAHNNQESMMKFTTPANCYYFRDSIAKADIDTVKIEKGDTATSYSPYGQGSTEIKKINKNLFKITAESRTVGGIEYTVNDDGTVSANGTSTGAYLNLNDMTLKKGTYTFSGGPENGGPTSQKLSIYDMSKGSGSNLIVLDALYGEKTYTHTFEEDTDIRITYVVPAGTIVNNEVVKLQVEHGNKVTEFTKNKEDNCILPIQQEMLQNDYFDLKTLEEVHNWSEINVSELLSKDIAIGSASTEQYYVFQIPLGNENQIAEKVLCEKLKFLGFEKATNQREEEGIAINQDAKYFGRIWIKASRLSEKSISAFLSWCAEENIIVKALIEDNETRLPMTSEQIEIIKQLSDLDLFDGTNNIITAEDIALLKLKYVVDTKTYIDNQIADMQNQLNTINELLSTTATSSILLDNLQTDLESEVM